MSEFEWSIAAIITMWIWIPLTLYLLSIFGFIFFSLLDWLSKLVVSAGEFIYPWWV